MNAVSIPQMIYKTYKWGNITMKYVFLRFPEGKAKAVTFSYDDGCKDEYCVKSGETVVLQ